MIRLLMADDHAILRAGLAELFALQPDIRLVGQASNEAELMSLLAQAPADLLLLDLNMPGSSGAARVSQVRRGQPALPILVLSMHSDPAVVASTLELGASGYVTKGADAATLMQAVRAVAGGERFVEACLVAGLDACAAGPGAARLSRREQQVLDLIVAGLRLGEIADRLFLSAKTVSTHKTHIMSKLGVDNNADLIRHAIGRAARRATEPAPRPG